MLPAFCPYCGNPADYSHELYDCPIDDDWEPAKGFPPKRFDSATGKPLEEPQPSLRSL